MKLLQPYIGVFDEIRLNNDYQRLNGHNEQSPQISRFHGNSENLGLKGNLVEKIEKRIDLGLRVWLVPEHSDGEGMFPKVASHWSQDGRMVEEED